MKKPEQIMGHKGLKMDTAPKMGKVPTMPKIKKAKKKKVKKGY